MNLHLAFWDIGIHPKRINHILPFLLNLKCLTWDFHKKYQKVKYLPIFHGLSCIRGTVNRLGSPKWRK